MYKHVEYYTSNKQLLLYSVKRDPTDTLYGALLWLPYRWLDGAISHDLASPDRSFSSLRQNIGQMRVFIRNGDQF